MILFITTFLCTAMLSALIHIGTRIAVGKRADTLFAGLFIATLALLVVLTPWWAIVLGAISGHAASVCMFYYISKNKVPRIFLNSALISSLICITTGYFTMIASMEEITQIVARSESNQLKEFSSYSEANRFVADNYQPCISATSGIILSRTKTDPLVCRASTIQLGLTYKGNAFSEQVLTSIIAWEKRKKTLNANDSVRVNYLLLSIGLNNDANLTLN